MKKLKKGQSIKYYAREGIISYIKNDWEIGVSWDKNKPGRTDIIFSAIQLEPFN